jgi:hypothetical protein
MIPGFRELTNSINYNESLELELGGDIDVDIIKVME